MSSKPSLLVLSSLFPSSVRPKAGLFVRERMTKVADKIPVFVVSPVPWFPLQGLIRLWVPDYRLLPEMEEQQGRLQVYYPRYLALPFFFRGLDAWMMAASVRRLIQQKEITHFDIIDSHFSYPDGRAAGYLKQWFNKPTSITMRGTEVPHSSHFKMRQRLIEAWTQADKIFSVSDSLKQLAIKHGIAAEKITVVGNGVDSQRFYPLDRDTARQQLDISADAQVLITVGGLVERKGFHRVIECLPQLIKQHPNLLYLIVGGASPEGNWEPKLKELVKQLKLEQHVRFLGEKTPDELRIPLSAADLFVLATRNEGWANVLLEAMACGLPVVATDVGGNKEVVSKPELGTIVPFGDSQALTEAIHAALLNNWQQPKIIAYAADNSWDKRVALLIKEFQTLETLPRAQQTNPSSKSGNADSGSLYTRLISSLVFPLHERLKDHKSVAIRKSLEQSQWYSPEAITTLQQQKLKAFITKVYQTVPYYRQLLDQQALSPEQICSSSDLAKLPLLTKELIRQNETTLKATDATGLKKFNTGGSSGSPLIFFLNNERVSHDVAEKWRATRWWNVDIGDREIVAWGSPIELTGQDRIKMIRDKVMRTELIPAFDLGEKQIQAFIERIRDFKPKMLFGYPSVYDLIARKAQEQGIKLDNLGIKVAFVTSERLYDHQRERIEQVFGCPVANGYGGRDAGFIAHQCPHGGMHISAEDIIVEIIDSEGKPLPAGESGEIVVTHMATSAFPFIRYRTGDIGTLSTQSCSCGRGLPLLEKIEGRTTDFVVAQDGTMMHGLALIYVLREIPEIQEFKIIQENLNETTVCVVLSDSTLSPTTLQKITSGFQQRLGRSVQINVDKVDKIEPEKSGKYRYVQSKVTGSHP
tara:strand:- start:37762 stop:40371 length:2610 start_codon:yes stop_codon:yes gene_type:complete